VLISYGCYHGHQCSTANPEWEKEKMMRTKNSFCTQSMYFRKIFIFL
jgi:hypothetical protein